MIFEQLSSILPGLQKNVSLAEYSNFKIGGPAEYFFIANNDRQIMDAIAAAKKLGLPFYIFGGGTNLIFSDEGLRGLIIKIQNQDTLSVDGEKITAGAGVGMDVLVSTAINHSLAGLEWAGGLPGTFGGAIRGNAGAFGGEIKDTIVEVEALADGAQIKKFTNAECQFSYRNSIFKEKGWIILSATIQLKKGDNEALQQIADSRIAYRKEKHPLEYPSAGSVFKNVPVQIIPAQFQEQFKDKIKQDPFPIVPAAWFIIGAGLTGMQIGQAQISKKHSNYIINLGGAKAQDILQLIELVKKTVKQKYGIDFEVEVQYVK